MKPIKFIERLQAIAQEARHHPEPQVSVSLLAQLLLDVSLELQPLAKKYGLLIQSSGFMDVLEHYTSKTESDLKASIQIPMTDEQLAQVNADIATVIEKHGSYTAEPGVDLATDVAKKASEIRAAAAAAGDAPGTDQVDAAAQGNTTDSAQP